MSITPHYRTVKELQQTRSSLLDKMDRKVSRKDEMEPRSRTHNLRKLDQRSRRTAFTPASTPSHDSLNWPTH